MVIVLYTDYFCFVLSELVKALTFLYVPKSSSTIKWGSADIAPIRIEFYWSDFAWMSSKILEHFPVNIPQSSCVIEGTCSYQIFIWKMAETQTKNSLPMPRQSAKQLSSTGIPYLASSVITWGRKKFSILTKSTLSQRLHMCFEFEELIIFFQLRTILVPNFYIWSLILLTASDNSWVWDPKILLFWGTKTVFT